MKRTLGILALAATLLSAELAANRMVHGAWEAIASDVNPSPVPHPNWNPFALFGSPTGRWIAAMMSDSANTRYHFGIGEKSDDLPRTPVARFLNAARASMAPRGHVDAGDAGILGRKGAPSHRLGEYARATSADAMETAYLLDPTNYAAFLVLSGDSYRWPEWIRSMTVEIAPGVKIPAPIMLARSICLYSRSKLDTTSGLWPEHSLYAAKILQSRWILDVLVGERICGGKRDNPATTPENKARVAEEIESLVRNAQQQRKELERSGRWELRSRDSRDFYDTIRREAEGFSRELRKSIRPRNELPVAKAKPV